MRSKLLDLQQFLEQYNKTIDIICLNETKLSKPLKHYISGYIVANAVFSTNSTHGTMILVKTGLDFKTLDPILERDAATHAVYEQVSIQVIPSEGNVPINIVCVYNSPTMNIHWSSLRSFNSNTIVVGDLNAKHVQLGNNLTNASGEVLLHELDLNMWYLLNNGQPTRKDDSGRSDEMLDLHLCTADMKEFFRTFSVCESLGSDHFPTVSCFATQGKLNTTTLPRRVDLKQYRETVQQLCANSTVLTNNQPPDSEDELEAFTKDLVNAISKSLTSAERHQVQRTLTKETMRLVKEKRRHRRQLKQLGAHSPEYTHTRMMVNKLQKQIRRSLKEANWNNQEKLLQSARGKPGRLFWRSIKLLSGSEKKQTQYPVLTSGGIQADNDPSRAEMFKVNLESNMKVPVPQGHLANQFDADLDPEALAMNNSMTTTSISVDELELTLKAAKDSAPGPDRITYKHIQWLPLEVKKLICVLFSASITTGSVPRSLKETYVHMLHKPKKDAKNPSSYRPISLTNCLSKLCETAVKNRILEHCESNDVFGETQSAYRHGRQTTDNLLQLTQYTAEAFQWREMVGAVFLDVEKAFDAVWRLCLAHKLNNLNLHPNLTAWVLSFLANRQVTIRVNHSFSNPFTPEAGVPQGSVISPILFLIYVAKPPVIKVQVSQFADDFAIYYRSKSPHIIEKNIQQALDLLSDWCDLNRIKLNPTKTNSILFHHPSRWKQKKVLKLQLKGQFLENVESVKFLGLTLTSSLSWDMHIDELVKKAGQRMCILYQLVRSNVPQSNLLIIYKTMIRSLFTYANAAWINHTKSQSKKMQTIQNRALRVCLGLGPGSNVTAMHRDANLPLLSDLQSNLAQRYFKKAVCSEKPWALTLAARERQCPKVHTVTPLSILLSTDGLVA